MRLVPKKRFKLHEILVLTVCREIVDIVKRVGKAMWRHNPRHGALAVACKPLIIK